MAVGIESLTRLSLNPLTVQTLLCQSFPPKARETRTIRGLFSFDHGVFELHEALELFFPSTVLPSYFVVRSSSLEVVIILCLSLSVQKKANDRLNCLRLQVPQIFLFSLLEWPSLYKVPYNSLLNLSLQTTMESYNCVSKMAKSTS